MAGNKYFLLFFIPIFKTFPIKNQPHLAKRDCSGYPEIALAFALEIEEYERKARLAPTYKTPAVAFLVII